MFIYILDFVLCRCTAQYGPSEGGATPLSIQRRNYRGRVGGNSPDSRPLDPQVPEFEHAHINSRTESNQGPLNRAGYVTQNHGK
jgi:hypothetical protein